MAAAAAATPALARYNVGVEAVISAARGAAVIVGPVAAAGHFDSSCGRFQTFRGACRNGKSIPRYEGRGHNGGSRYNEFLHVFLKNEQNGSSSTSC